MKADSITPVMANLPKARVTPARPFLTTGVDYAGPIKLLLRGGRGQRRIVTESYVAIFVCFMSKAIHLELVSNLTFFGPPVSYFQAGSRQAFPMNRLRPLYKTCQVFSTTTP